MRPLNRCGAVSKCRSIICHDCNSSRGGIVRDGKVVGPCKDQPSFDGDGDRWIIGYDGVGCVDAVEIRSGDLKVLLACGHGVV